VYSLWLTFDAALAHELELLIADLARQTGGPVFTPHMTLAGDLDRPRDEVLALAQTIAPAFCSERAEFGHLDFGDTYFQSVFLTVSLRESILGLRQALLAQLDLSPAYPPHVSLAYGARDLRPGNAVLADIERWFARRPAPFASLDVMASSEDRPVEQWRCVSRISLLDTDVTA
jgi:hypothetical protein